MKIGNISKTKEILNKYNFFIKKKFGQNFLIDENILNNIVSKANLDDTIGVIEIGPGLGALTSIIAANCKKVLCYEIDETLLPILEETLAEFNNVKIINQDILKADVNKDLEYFSDCKKVYVIANLPYYITTPILLHLLETTNINKYVVMMQKEVADRICSKASVKEYNSLSIAIQYRAKCKKLLNVPKTVFIPKPNVDSAVISIEVYDELPIKAKDEKFFFEIVRSSFAQRRKTLINNLEQRFEKNKEFFENIIKELGFPVSVRAEELSVADFVKLSELIKENLDEVWDLFDQSGKFVKTIKRGEKIPDGLYHNVVFAVIKCNDKFLIQKRSNKKLVLPGVWACTGGSALSKEKPEEAVVREVKEELGLDIRGHFKFKSSHYDKHALVSVYLVEMEFKLEDIVTNEEVSEVKLLSLEELKTFKGLYDRDYKMILSVR